MSNIFWHLMDLWGYIICIANSSAMAFLNPNHNLNQSIDLAFNTAISF